MIVILILSLLRAELDITDAARARAGGGTGQGERNWLARESGHLQQPHLVLKGGIADRYSVDRWIGSAADRLDLHSNTTATIDRGLKPDDLSIDRCRVSGADASHEGEQDERGYSDNTHV